ncbi:hypothetical protein [Methanosarcina spelaei]|uniref:hypothetical protein n=1 Tax=Methanosarcina spelaei TaxID=1036679 RepID=UPI0037439C3E
MRAVVYKGLKDVAVEEVDDPKIENPRDAIIKLTSTAICGSDLHMYDGRTVAETRYCAWARASWSCRGSWRCCYIF